MGLQRIYFSLVKGLSKMTFLHLKLNALRIDRSCFHAHMPSDLFNQIKLSFWVTSWGFFFLFLLSFFKFSRYMFTFLKNHLNFHNAFVLDKYQHDFFCFCTHFGGPKKNILENIWDYVWFWKKGKHQRICCSFVSKSCAQNVIYT